MCIKKLENHSFHSITQGTRKKSEFSQRNSNLPSDFLVTAIGPFLKDGVWGKGRWGIKAVTVSGTGKKLDNPHIPVAVIDGDWLTVEWTFSDPGVEVKGDFDETMTVLDKGWASVGVVLETCTPMDEVTAFDKEDDGFREETVALGLGDTVAKDKEI